MKYLDFYQYFSRNWESPVFSINDIKNVFADFNNVQLSQWQKKGYISRIRKNQYLIIKDFRDINLLAYDLKRSYISMEYALSKHGLIPEAVFEVTSITTERSEKVETPLGLISYRKIKPSLFIGYELLSSSDYSNRKYAMAGQEKALFDLVYFRNDLKDENDFESLRLSISRFNKTKFQGFIRQVKHAGRKTRLLTFFDYIC